MNIGRTLNQTVSWQAISSTDVRDDATYAAAVSLRARKVQKLKDLIGKDGEVTTATNQIMMGPSCTVKVGDLLDGREVVAISDMVAVNGTVVGYTALTR